MATLTSAEARKIRNAAERKADELGVPVRWTKQAIEAAGQAVLDHIDGRAAAISADMDAATAPFGITFTGAEKKWIGATALEIKYLRDIG